MPFPRFFMLIFVVHFQRVLFPGGEWLQVLERILRYDQRQSGSKPWCRIWGIWGEPPAFGSQQPNSLDDGTMMEDPAG